MNSSDRNQILFVFLFLLFLAIPRAASAGVEFLSTPSLLRSPSKGTILFEDTRFRFSADRGPVSFHFSGSNPVGQAFPAEDLSKGILDFAYLELPVSGTNLSLGRIHIDGGEPIEGLHTLTGLSDSTEVSFFTGRTVSAANDVIGGGFSWKVDGRSKLGFSYIRESAGPETFREETAIDLRLRLWSRLALSGRSHMDLTTGTWTEHSYMAKIGPFQRTTLTVNAEILGLGAGSPGSGSADRLLTVGAGVQHSLSRQLDLGFNVRRGADPFSGTAYQREVSFSYSPVPAWNTAISVTHHDGETSGYVEMNAHASRRTGDLETLLELRKIVRAASDSMYGNASQALGFAYRISPAYRLVADMDRSRGQRTDLRAFFKLEYRFGA